jgi:hypothetical protein
MVKINSAKKLKHLPSSVIFPSPLTKNCTMYQLPAAFAVFFGHLHRVLNLDHSSKKDGLYDLSLLIEGDKVVAKYALTEWAPARIGKWVQVDQVKRERCMIREKAKYGFQIAGQEVFNYC